MKILSDIVAILQRLLHDFSDFRFRVFGRRDYSRSTIHRSRGCEDKTTQSISAIVQAENVFCAVSQHNAICIRILNNSSLYIEEVHGWPF